MDEHTPSEMFDNAFDPSYLARLESLDDPASAAPAELAGPWEVVALGQAEFGVFRGWESPESGDLPHCIFDDPHLARLAAAMLPALSREPAFRLRADPTLEGYPVERHGEVCGRTRIWDHDLMQALSLAHELAQQPEALAKLLEAAGPTALELVGKRLARGIK
ncbi:MAG TPA: hypothetical protein VF017_07675 [Thermoanaerobaculia bacterium]|nr:hypothetical protein [Thermoanaerobaculia bacterium]